MSFVDITVDELKKIMEKKLFKELYPNSEVFYNKLKSSTLAGIPATPDDIENRKKAFGMNYISPKETKSFFRYVLDAMDNLIIKFLIVSAIIMIIINTIFEEDKSTAWIEGVAILVAVIVVSFVTAFNDHKKEHQFRKLQSKLEQEKKTSVIRAGTTQEISTKDILVGDLICLSYGDQIPADCLIIQSSDLQVDESSLTGESDLIKKDSLKNPYIFSGTNVMVGSGQAIVTAVGPNSQAGQIFVLLGMSNNTEPTTDPNSAPSDGKKKAVKAVENDDKGHSLLEEKLNKMAINIGRLGIVCGAGIFLTLLIRFCIETYTGANATSFKKEHLISITHFIIQGITMLVVTIPEGLPLAVAISLSFSVMKMLKCHNLVRQLYSCETMGSATTICTDKTGTLTTNRMTVVQWFIDNILFTKIPSHTEVHTQLVDLTCTSIAINTNSSSRIEEPLHSGALPKQIGNKTECALLGFVNALKRNYETLRSQNADNIAKVFTFNSERKYMATAIRLSDGKYRLFAKGASEIILQRCKSIVSSSNQSLVSRPISEVDFKNINCHAIEPMANDALRTICLAYRDFETEPNWDEEQFCLNNLTFICITGIEDPVRPEVPKAIIQCQEAGIVVRMVTGDNVVTARSIAIKCGILKPNEPFLVLEGQEFNKRIRDHTGKINQEEFDAIWPNLRVLARSSPTDKYNLVSGIISSHLSANREVVAVTGDGTNDAPALKRADVGFAMGISGTDVAKEASDIIITNDNFASIVKAVLWGRNVYDNISKFIQFQLTVNFSAVVINAVTSLVLKTTALRAVQLLWVNLIMDTLASLALATDEPTLDMLKRKPYGRNKSLISRAMVRFIVLHGLYQILVILILCFIGPDLFDIENGFDNPHAKQPGPHLTLVFNVFVLMQLFNEINARKIHGERNVFAGLFSNKIFIGVVLGTLLFQVIIVQFTSKAFWVAPLDLELWLWSICLAFSELIWNQLVVVTLPKWLIPASLRLGRNGVSSKDLISRDQNDNNARIMWLRGLTRLQTQLRIVNAFRMGVDHTQRTRSVASPVVLQSLLVPLGVVFMDSNQEKKSNGPISNDLISPHSNVGLVNEIHT